MKAAPISEAEINEELMKLATGDTDSFDTINKYLEKGALKSDSIFPYLKQFFETIKEVGTPKYSLWDKIEAEEALDALENGNDAYFRQRKICPPHK